MDGSTGRLAALRSGVSAELSARAAPRISPTPTDTRFHRPQIRVTCPASHGGNTRTFSPIRGSGSPRDQPELEAVAERRFPGSLGAWSKRQRRQPSGNRTRALRERGHRRAGHEPFGERGRRARRTTRNEQNPASGRTEPASFAAPAATSTTPFADRGVRPPDRQSGHALGMTPSGVEQSGRSPMTMAGVDLLFLAHEYLGVVVRRRA